MKKLIILILILFLFTGCSKKPTSEKKEISLILWAAPYELELFNKVITSFEKSHPNIKVKLFNVIGTYQEKLITMAVGNQLPDVVRINEWQMLGFLDKDIFLPLDTLIDSDPEIKREDFLPIAIEQYTYNGHLYAVSFGIFPLVLYYNQTLFDREGVPYPDRSWKWDDFLKAAQKLTKVTEDSKITQYGFMTDAQFFYWVSFLWQNEGEFMENGKWVLGDPKYKANNIGALQFVVDLIHKYKVASLAAGGKETMSFDQLFMSGKVAMFICGPWVSLPFKEMKDFKWNIAELPYQKKRATFAIENGFCISKKSKYPNEAFELIKALTSFNTSKEMEEVGFLISPRKDICGRYFLLEVPELKREVFTESLEYGHIYPVSPLWYRIKEEIFDQEIEKAFLNLTSPEETVDNIEKRVKQEVGIVP